MSGMQISYNTLLQGSGLGRLISVNILDDDLQVYLPLDHATLYIFGTYSWMCIDMDHFPSLFQTMGMEGEDPGSVDESIEIHNLGGEYLTSLGEPYNMTLRGSHVNNTDAFEQSNGTFDILAGARVELNSDIGSNATHRGLHFSVLIILAMKV